MGVVKKIQENMRPLSETILLIMVSCIPFHLDLQSRFANYMELESFNPENYIWKIAIEYGNITISALLFVLSCFTLRQFNKDFLMNKLNVYHNYPYWWYWYCAKILGIGNCNLVNTPIYLQVKLVMQNTFDNFPFEDGDYPQKENEPINVRKLNTNRNYHEVNLILEDTYPISASQIPRGKRTTFTIDISRNNDSRARYYSPCFIAKTIEEVGLLDNGTTVNLFATTNPKNMLHITHGAFTRANRGAIAHLYIFQQSTDERRRFLPKGKKIF